MRIGLPASSTTRSSGPQKPSGGPPIGWPRPYQACRPASVQRGPGMAAYSGSRPAHRCCRSAFAPAQRAAGMEPIRMRGDAPHRAEGDRTPDHTFLSAAGPIRPRLLNHHLFFERDMRDFGCKTADRLRRDAGPAHNIGGRVFFAEITFGQNMKTGFATRPSESVCSPFIAGDTSARSALASAFDC